MLKTKTVLSVLFGFYASTHSGFGQANFWEQTGGPTSVRLTVLAMRSPDSVYAGTRKGILRSTNMGDTWKAIGLSDRAVNALLFPPGGNIYAGTTTGLCRSSNEGISWDSSAMTGLPRLSVSCLAVHPSGDLYAGYHKSTDYPGGLFRSTDSGDHWTQVLMYGVGIAATSIAIDGDGRIFLTVNGQWGIYRSTDNGTGWTLKDVTAPQFTSSIISVLAMSVNGIIFAGTLHAEVARSTNHGDSWDLVGTGFRALAVANQDTLFMGKGLGRVVRSTNAGLSWTESAVWNRADVVLAGSGGLVFAGYHTIYRSTNSGTSWSPLDAPAWSDVEVHALATGKGDTLYAGGSDGLFLSTDDGNSWRELNMGGVENTVEFLAINSRGHVFAYMAAMHSALYRSTDNGQQWVSLGRLPYPAINASDHIFAVSWWVGPVVRSADNGENWDTVYTAPPGQGVACFAIDIHNHIFVTTDGGGIYRSTDNGLSWDSVNIGLTTRNVWNLATAANGDIFAGTDSNVVFRSTDDGSNWTRLYSQPSWISAMVANATGDLFVAIPGMGIYRNGVELNSGLTDLGCHSLALDSEGYLFVGTTESSVFRSVQSTTGLKEIALRLPRAFTLQQNYPNPFNPSSTIKFELPMSSVVRLSIFDMLGREVSVLVNERKEAGGHEVTIDAAGLASGVYFYRLTAGRLAQTRKMLLLR